MDQQWADRLYRGVLKIFGGLAAAKK